MTDFVFPVGYHQMHKTKIIDFQLNRWHSFGYCRLEDIQEAAGRISNLKDWKTEMVKQAEKAAAENQMMNAAFLFRAAEFFTPPSNPDKEQLYAKFKELFYNVVFKDEKIQRFSVPFFAELLDCTRIAGKNVPS